MTETEQITRTIDDETIKSTKVAAIAEAIAPRFWCAEDFTVRELPEKEIMIEGLLHRRDMIALVGRRRHGKTNFILNLAVAIAARWPDFLGYPVAGAFRVMGFLLEDDAREIQDKLRSVIEGSDTAGRLALVTRDDFRERSIPVDVDDKNFCAYVEEICEEQRPDLIIFDNLAQMVNAEYNNPKRIHTLARFTYGLAKSSNAAVLMAAHPRKRSQEDFTPTIQSDPEGFFEEVMGSSHFINSFGSLWGLERDQDTNRTIFLGGAQRVTGEQSVASFELDENRKIRLISDYEVNLEYALNTSARRRAWGLLPDTPFTYIEGCEAVKSAMKSSSTFHAWWKDFLIRLGLVVAGDSRWVKVQRPAQAENNRGNR